ncbi:N-acetylmuramoyl-L-alanine amidase [Tamlana sp. 2_MG-2023]|uniref:N-acetylmuramoyl-L-alanine amidase family protein n=1 Tax=unclassified Tamlana TaxID=2614803 RepID=UPI0026E2FFC8|nr:MULTISPECIES: N-acetylmuramoyl-L-alanine amidase [unclassified Tamlana]MDO6759305.1 N-acetylmuramoyl-L-alanine amidase [Tamlana sp. 2_MG-2023]MDO6790556.1 N-acetylmuramoyl-L-alanine amidase [Tamlana sp. 1_MG-2023]
MKTHKILHFVLIIMGLTCASFVRADNEQPNKKFVVVLDAGHGGHDPGNMGNGFKEKEIALKVVLRVGELLEKNPNIKVIYTRKSDKFIDLFVRGKIANEANADLFVSVHCNAHGSSAHGTETFVLGTHRNNTNFEVAKKENSVIFMEEDYEKNYAGFDPNSPESVMSILLSQEEYLDQSIMLASLIQKAFTNTLQRKDRGVKQAGFIVLHQTVMPSVLVETGFLSYKKEGAYLNSSKGQQQISEAIFNAILEYKKGLDKSVHGYLPVENVIEEVSSQTIENKEIPIIDSSIVFKVQIAASSKFIENQPYNFNGLHSVSSIKTAGLYKYYYGNTSSYEEVKGFESEAKKNGYPSSFIVAFKDGNKIPLGDALKSIGN